MAPGILYIVLSGWRPTHPRRHPGSAAMSAAPTPSATAATGRVGSVSERPRRYRVGVDVGGTFTDLILMDETSGDFVGAKTPSRPGEPHRAILEGLADLLAREQVAPREVAPRKSWARQEGAGGGSRGDRGSRR